MSWAGTVTLEVSVSFTTAPLAAPSWTDITAYVKKVTTTTGRTKELGPFDPGTLELELDNSDRRFDPLHATGPYYGNLLPNRQVRVRATYSAVTYDVFYGFIDGWPQEYGLRTSFITIRATDAFKLLATMRLPSSVYEISVMSVTPRGWWRFADRVGTQWTDSSGNAYHASFSAGVDAADAPRGERPLLVDAGESLDLWEAGGLATLPTSVSLADQFTFEFWILMASNSGTGLTAFIWTADVLVSAVYILDREIGFQSSVGNYKVTNTDPLTANKLCHVAITKDGTDVDIYVNGVNQALTSTGTIGDFHDVIPSIRAGNANASGTEPDRWEMAELALYPSVLSFLEINEHYQAGVTPWSGDTTGERVDRVLDYFSWPAGMRDVDTGSNTLASARIKGMTALDYLRILESSEAGQLYCDHRSGGDVRFDAHTVRQSASRSTTVQYTLSDDSGATYHYDDLKLSYDERDIVNEVIVKWAEGEVVSTDATSVIAYGLRSLTVNTELETAADAATYGEWILGRYKDPTTKCRSVRIDPAVHTALFAPALNAKISDRFTIRRLPQNTGSAIEKNVLIEGISHEIANGVGTWKTTLTCSEADSGPWWVLDTADLGTGTRLAD